MTSQPSSSASTSRSRSRVTPNWSTRTSAAFPAAAIPSINWTSEYRSRREVQRLPALRQAEQPQHPQPLANRGGTRPIGSRLA